jgi:DNA-binding transcriptional MerR regulator
MKINMPYTINEVAAKFGLSAHTLRYYDKEGLLPFISRNSSGNRSFSDNDLDWVALICCLKDTGMPIKEIKQYMEWAKEGGRSIHPRKEMLTLHRQAVLKQIDDLANHLKLIDNKIAFYEQPGIAEKLDQHFGIAEAEGSDYESKLPSSI